MNFRLYPLCISVSLLSPMGVQAAFAHDADSLSIIQPQSLDTLTTVPNDSIILAAPVEIKEVEETPVVAVRPAPALMDAWRKRYPLASSKGKTQVSAYEALSRSALYQSLDTLSPDRSLSYAQRDLRLPIILDAEVPAAKTSSLFQAESQGLLSWPTYSYVDAYTRDAQNPFGRQLEYGAMRGAAVFDYAIRHLDQVALMRPENYDLPTERKRIERKELQGFEQVETDLALELEPSGLNVEQVTFHADKWHRRGFTDLQISQTSLSEQWHTGGETNLTISTHDKLSLSRYDESQKTKFDVTFELRLSGYYAKSDIYHPMRVGSDNDFTTNLSYSYKAWKKWYYSTSANLKTPVFERFETNKKVLKSTFLSPLEFNYGIGMAFEEMQNKRFNCNWLFAPFSYNGRYVQNDEVLAADKDIKEGRRSRHDFGASVTGNMEWKMTKSMTWVSRTYFFTSYHVTKLELENTFMFTLGRYSTAKIYIYPRLDDGRSNVDNWQWKETMTFGLAFNW